MTDIVEELRAHCLASHQMPARLDGPNEEELRVLERDPRWQAAAEIERLRDALAGWQPMHTAPKDDVPVLLSFPASRVMPPARSWSASGASMNRRSFGYWVSDVGMLDGGFAETGPWIEYPELRPRNGHPCCRARRGKRRLGRVSAATGVARPRPCPNRPRQSGRRHRGTTWWSSPSRRATPATSPDPIRCAAPQRNRRRRSAAPTKSGRSGW